MELIVINGVIFLPHMKKIHDYIAVNYLPEAEGVISIMTLDESYFYPSDDSLLI